MAAIQFFSEKTRFKLKNPRKTASWIKSVIKAEDKALISLNYIFCSDEHLRGINVEYLNHKTYTDIITFNYNPSKAEIEGEIYISIDRVKENAEKFKVEFEIELHRVIIHGVLHLIGYNDKTKTQKSLMREKEDSYLSLLKISK
jgi:probable rRNA maturation factor